MPDQSIIEHIRAEAKRLGASLVLDPTCSRFRDPSIAEALALWRSKAGPEGIARRRDLTPRSMQKFLPKVAIFERVVSPAGERRYRARLTGPKFVTAYAEMSGRFIDEVVSAEYLPRWHLMADGVLNYGAPLRALIVPEAFDRDYLVGEYLLAPLLDDDGNSSQILSVVNYESHLSWQAVEAEELAYLAKGSG